jgi:hypothetical protein
MNQKEHKRRRAQSERAQQMLPTRDKFGKIHKRPMTRSERNMERYRLISDRHFSTMPSRYDRYSTAGSSLFGFSSW